MNPFQNSLSGENTGLLSEKAASKEGVTKVASTSDAAYAAGKAVFFSRNEFLKWVQ